MGIRNPVYMAFKVNEGEKGDRLLSIVESAWDDGDRSRLEELLEEVEEQHTETFDIWEGGCLVAGLGFMPSDFLQNTAGYFEGFRQNNVNLQTRTVVYAGASKSDIMEYRAFLYHYLDTIIPIHENVFGFCSFDEDDNRMVFLTEESIRSSAAPISETHIASKGQPYSPQRIMRLITAPEKVLNLSVKEDNFEDWDMWYRINGFVDLLTTAVDQKDIHLAQKILFVFDVNQGRNFYQEDLIRREFSDKYLLGEYTYPTDARMKEVIDFLKPRQLIDWRIWLPELCDLKT